MDSVGIYLREATELSIALVVLLGAVSACTWVLEVWRQTSERSVLRLAALDAIWAVAGFFVLHLASYLLQWHSRRLGGEVPAALLSLGAALVLLFLVKVGLYRLAGVTFQHPWVVAALPHAVVGAVLGGLWGFVFLLGSAWSI